MAPGCSCGSDDVLEGVPALRTPPTCPEGKINILGAGITRLNTKSLPLLVPLLTLVIRLRLDDEDPPSYAVTVAFEDPSGAAVMPELGGQVEAGHGDTAEGEEFHLNLVLAFGPLQFRTAGVHRLRVSLDGALLREMSIPVVLHPRDQGDDQGFED